MILIVSSHANFKDKYQEGRAQRNSIKHHCCQIQALLFCYLVYDTILKIAFLIIFPFTQKF